MVYKTPVLRTLIHVRKTYVNECTLNMRLLDLHVYHALNVRLTCVLKTHVLRMLHIFLCSCIHILGAFDKLVDDLHKSKACQ